MDRAAADPGPGPTWGGPDLKGQGQGQQNQVRASLDRPVDSLATEVQGTGA